MEAKGMAWHGIAWRGVALVCVGIGASVGAGAGVEVWIGIVALAVRLGTGMMGEAMAIAWHGMAWHSYGMGGRRTVCVSATSACLSEVLG